VIHPTAGAAMRTATALALALAPCLSFSLSGCGVTRLQSARTVATGETQTTVATGVVHNALRDFPISGIPLEIMVRHGATDRLDFGARLFMGLGMLGDIKWNLLPPDRRTAVALSVGLGGAVEPSGSGSEKAVMVAHVPLSITASRDVTPWLTPYAALGYGSYWIFNYDGAETMLGPEERPAARRWTGDGLLSAHLGLELRRATGRALLLEYAVARPVVNDPGDSYGFTTNHFFSIGFHTGRSGQPPALSR
jgi:hypothetical protein